MKNYLVKSLFRVADPDWKIHNRSHEENLYEKYVELHQISLGSYKAMLGGDWEFKFFGGTVDQINHAFEKTFWAIHNLWHSESCNILYTDPDTIALKPFDPWNQYKYFSMFNYTDPRFFNKPNQWSLTFPHFFNAGVRYFPATMNPEIWKLGADMAQNWNYETYDTEQLILNNMMWAQGIAVADVLNPQLAYQAFHPVISKGNQWNGIDINNATIVHFHSSRDVDSRVQVMKKVEKNLNII